MQALPWSSAPIQEAKLPRTIWLVKRRQHTGTVLLFPEQQQAVSQTVLKPLEWGVALPSFLFSAG